MKKPLLRQFTNGTSADCMQRHLRSIKPDITTEVRICSLVEARNCILPTVPETCLPSLVAQWRIDPLYCHFWIRPRPSKRYALFMAMGGGMHERLSSNDSFSLYAISTICEPLNWLVNPLRSVSARTHIFWG